VKAKTVLLTCRRRRQGGNAVADSGRLPFPEGEKKKVRGKATRVVGTSLRQRGCNKKRVITSLENSSGGRIGEGGASEEEEEEVTKLQVLILAPP